MFSVTPEISRILFQLSRYVFAFLGVLILLSGFGWVVSENRARKSCQRRLPALGMIGELVVMSGNSELPAQTWFPLPREGVLGSVRSCDLVVPGAGIRSHHLDFRWQDGTGLLIHPRSGCEALVNGTLLNCRSDICSFPLTHGAYLQVGNVIMQLRLFVSMDQSVRMALHVSADGEPVPSAVDPASFGPVSYQPDLWGMIQSSSPAGDMPAPPVPNPSFIPLVPVNPGLSAESAADLTVPDASVTPAHPFSSSSWKEDWSE